LKSPLPKEKVLITISFAAYIMFPLSVHNLRALFDAQIVYFDRIVEVLAHKQQRIAIASAGHRRRQTISTTSQFTLIASKELENIG
jgi:hypothetical protein